MPIQVGASCKISATFPTPVGGGQERLSFSTFLRIQPGADSEIPKKYCKTIPYQHIEAIMRFQCWFQ
jgi:hypothetical protein